MRRKWLVGALALGLVSCTIPLSPDAPKEALETQALADMVEACSAFDQTAGHLGSRLLGLAPGTLKQDHTTRYAFATESASRLCKDKDNPGLNISAIRRVTEDLDRILVELDGVQ